MGLERLADLSSDNCVFASFFMNERSMNTSKSAKLAELKELLRWREDQLAVCKCVGSLAHWLASWLTFAN